MARKPLIPKRTSQFCGRSGWRAAVRRELGLDQVPILDDCVTEVPPQGEPVTLNCDYKSISELTRSLDVGLRTVTKRPSGSPVHNEQEVDPT